MKTRKNAIDFTFRHLRWQMRCRYGVAYYLFEMYDNWNNKSVYLFRYQHLFGNTFNRRLILYKGNSSYPENIIYRQLVKDKYGF